MSPPPATRGARATARRSRLAGQAPPRSQPHSGSGPHERSPSRGCVRAWKQPSRCAPSRRLRACLAGSLGEARLSGLPARRPRRPKPAGVGGAGSEACHLDARVAAAVVLVRYARPWPCTRGAVTCGTRVRNKRGPRERRLAAAAAPLLRTLTGPGGHESRARLGPRLARLAAAAINVRRRLLSTTTCIVAGRSWSAALDARRRRAPTLAAR